MMASLPTTDEFFGPAEQALSTPLEQQSFATQGGAPAAPAEPAAKSEIPTVDEFFAPGPIDLTVSAAKEAPGRMLQTAGAALGLSEPPPSSPLMDEFFSKTAYGRILRSMGQGLEQGWGEGPLSFAPETNDWMRKAGVYNDFTKGQQSLIKAFNEAWMRPAVTALGTLGEISLRGVNALYTGAQGFVIGAGREGEQALLSAGLPGMDLGLLARDIATMPDAFMGGPGAAGVPASRPSPVQTLTRARSLGVIGEGEAGWRGTKVAEDPKIAQQRYIEAWREWDETQMGEPRPAEGPQPGVALKEGEGVAAAQAAEPLPDLHQVAREINPQLFERYDALDQRKETFRRWIDELDETRRQAAAEPFDRQIAEIQGRMDGASARTAKRLQGEIDALQAQKQEALDGIKGDSPDMARIRQELLNTDFEMRDLAPEVSAAYRSAREALPEEARAAGEAPVEAPREAEGAPARPESEAAAAPEALQREATPVQPELPRQPELPLEAPRAAEPPRPMIADIAGDVRQKLEAAGRPAEEAIAAAEIVRSHYNAMAQRLGMAAEDLYMRDAPDIARSERPRKGEMGRTVFDSETGERIIKLAGKADASTFMHETGHVWLDDLMRYAKMDQAVADLKADAAAVRKWLGAAEDAEITRAQHEKFARGFERYLMEGRAPNKDLANVFEQFRRWLTDIYQTVTRLRSPITDEIRGVFDRLIAPERPEAVIAEDRKRGPDFADIHEADARSTAPADAAVAADRIRAESDEIARRLLEDYDDIFGPRQEPEGTPGASVADATGRLEPVTGPAGRGAGPGAAAADRGPAAGPAGGAEGGPAQSGAVSPGGGQPATESVGARGQRATGEAPVGPNDPLPPPETRLVDKAGNIRLDNLNIPEDVAQSIRQAAEESDEFMAARRGVVTDAQVLDLADALGMTPETLNTRKLGEAFNAEQIMAARKLLVQSATTVRDTMAKAAAGTDADVLAYAQAKARHMMIQEQVAGLTAEAGRALRAFRAFEGTLEAEQLTSFLKENTGKTLFQLRREAQLGAQLDTPGQVSKFVHDSKRATFGDMIIEFWINALLSGPTTHVKNIVGNMAVAVNRVFETGLAGAIGEARRAVGVGPETGVLVGEAKAALFGTFQGAKDGVIAGAKAFMTEQVPVSGTVEQRKYQAIPSAKVTIGGRELEIGGRQVRLPGRFLAFQDEFFRAIAHRQELNALAFREADNLGLTGDAFRQKVADILMNPSDEMMEAARKAGEYQTFTRALGPVGLRLQQLANSHPLLKIVIPFVRTPTNILKYAFERTPFGLLSSEIRANLSGKNGGAAMDTQIARLTMGTMVGAAFAGLALEGLVSGGGPSNPQEKAIMKGTGWEPYSLKIGEVWYNYDWLDPFATIMGLAADFAETAQRGIEEAQDADFWEALGKVTAMTFGSVSKNLMSKLSLRGASELIQAVTDPDRYGEKYLQGLAGTIVPSVVGQIARADDPVQRDARNMLDAVKARIPGLRDTLYPSRDIWGEPLRADEMAGPDFGSPVRMSDVSQDPVNRKLVELRLWPSKPGRTIRGVELTDQQYDDFARTAGRFAKMRLDAIIAMPQFSAAPDFVQRDMIRNVIENSRESARTLIMAQNPQIIQAAVEDKLRSMSGAPPRKGPIKQKEPQ